MTRFCESLPAEFGPVVFLRRISPQIDSLLLKNPVFFSAAPSLAAKPTCSYSFFQGRAVYLQKRAWSRKDPASSDSAPETPSSGDSGSYLLNCSYHLGIWPPMPQRVQCFVYLAIVTYVVFKGLWLILAGQPFQWWHDTSCCPRSAWGSFQAKPAMLNPVTLFLLIWASVSSPSSCTTHVIYEKRLVINRKEYITESDDEDEDDEDEEEEDEDDAKMIHHPRWKT